MTELKELQEEVVDTFNTYDAVRSDVYSIATRTAYVAWARARWALSDYLKEHGDDCTN